MSNLVQSGTIELRSSGTLHGRILEEGRASESLSELFLVGAVDWGSAGIPLRVDHKEDRGAETVFPYRRAASIFVNCAQPSVELRDAVQSGKRYMSVEFISIKERRTRSGIREIAKAMLVGVSLVKAPAYVQTFAEMRSARRKIKRYALWL